jgi:hypothetical protein
MYNFTCYGFRAGRPGAESLTELWDEYVWLCEAQALRGPGCLAGGFDLSTSALLTGA